MQWEGGKLDGGGIIAFYAILEILDVATVDLDLEHVGIFPPIAAQVVTANSTRNRWNGYATLKNTEGAITTTLQSKIDVAPEADRLILTVTWAITSANVGLPEADILCSTAETIGLIFPTTASFRSLAAALKANPLHCGAGGGDHLCGDCP